MLRKYSRIRRLWSEIRWILLGAIWLAGLILGVAGFNQYGKLNALDWSTGDILYQTLQLIPINSGAVGGKINWMLEISRFLLPALTVYTALQALMHLFNEQMQWLRLWMLRDHVIICGLGRKGDHLAGELLGLGQRVVAIEKDPEHTRAAELQRQGVLLLTGDATDRDILVSARLHRAHHLICLLGEDHQNLQVAFQAYQLTRVRRKGTLTCVIHLASADLLYLVKSSELSIEADVPFQIETFHPYARAAQLMIQEDPNWQEGADLSIVPGHLLVVGLGRLGEHLVVQAAYTWHRRKQRDRLYITILDREAAEKTAVLLQKHPQLARVCQLNPLPVDLSSTYLLNDALNQVQAHQPVQRVYICLSDPVLSLQVCWNLLQLPLYHTTPIRIRLEGRSGLSGLLAKPMTSEPYPSQVIPFDLYQRTCSAELVVGGLHELLARGLHEAYLSRVGDSSTLTSWDQLPEVVKEENRQQANRIHRLLTEAGHQVNPFQNWNAGEYVFNPAEVEQMARREHDLWCQEKQAVGWRPGPMRDRKERIHPDLVPWDELPEEERKKNEAFIRQLPSLLARLGFQIDYAEKLEELS